MKWSTATTVALTVLLNCYESDQLAKLVNFGKELQLQVQDAANVAVEERVIELKLP